MTDKKRVTIPQYAEDYPAAAETLEQARLPFYCCNCYRKKETTYDGMYKPPLILWPAERADDGQGA
jgi:hypothetical protein